MLLFPSPIQVAVNQKYFELFQCNRPKQSLSNDLGQPLILHRAIAIVLLGSHSAGLLLLFLVESLLLMTMHISCDPGVQ